MAPAERAHRPHRPAGRRRVREDLTDVEDLAVPRRLPLQAAGGWVIGGQGTVCRSRMPSRGHAAANLPRLWSTVKWSIFDCGRVLFGSRL